MNNSSRTLHRAFDSETGGETPGKSTLTQSYSYPRLMQIFFLFFLETKVLSLPMEIIHVKFSANATQELKQDKEIFKTQRISGVFCLRFQSYLLLVG